MGRTRLLFMGIVTAMLVTVTTQSAFGILIPLHSASRIPFSTKYPEHAQKLVRAALDTEGCMFIDGATAMRSTTINFAGDTQSINAMLQSLANCPGVSITVSFAAIEHKCDWRIVHVAKSNKFGVVVNLGSDQVKLDRLAIPPAVGPKLVP